MAKEIQVEVGEHGVYGTLANITIKPKPGLGRERLETRVAESLKGHTTNYELRLAHGQHSAGHCQPFWGALEAMAACAFISP